VSEQSRLTRFAWISIAAAVVTILLKTAAYWLTGSVGLLSDAVESLVNLAGGLMALSMLTIAARPEDEGHAFGHSKAEYFSSGFEGSLILLAAASIGFAAAQRLIHPKPIEQIGLGLAVSVGASLVNLGVALLLLRASKRYRSITLEANAHHLFTDVWTSAGVLVGVGAVAFTGWQRLDPMVAILVACNIVWTGVGIVRKSVSGLMDTALPEEEQEALKDVLEAHAKAGILFHAIRTRQAGSQRFVSLHVLVPGTWTVLDAHNLLERLEADIREALPSIHVDSHVEPLDDSASWDDVHLDRPGPPANKP
jgi:cation diffusion facilitator family transporter